MKKRDFPAAYERARTAYHANAADYTAHMDALVRDCTDQQWNAVRILSEQKFPPLSDTAPASGGRTTP